MGSKPTDHEAIPRELAEWGMRTRERLADEALRTASERTTPASAGGAWKRGLPWLIAASALIGGLLWFRGAIESPSPDQVLGTDRLVLRPPDEPVTADSSVLEWEYDLPPGGRYRLVLVGADGSTLVDTIVVEPRWEPDAITRARLSGTVLWTVEALDMEGEALTKETVTLEFFEALRSGGMLQGDDEWETVEALFEAVADGRASREEASSFARACAALHAREDPRLSLSHVATAFTSTEPRTRLRLDLGIRYSSALQAEGSAFESIEVLDELLLDEPQPFDRILLLARLAEQLTPLGSFSEAEESLELARDALVDDEANLRPLDRDYLTLVVLQATAYLQNESGLIDRLFATVLAYEERARRYRELVAQSDPERDLFLFNALSFKVDWLYHTGQYQRAREECRVALSLALPGRDEALIDMRLAAIAWDLGEEAEALERFERVVRNPGAGEELLLQAEARLAEARYVLGDVEEAERQCRLAVRRAGAMVPGSVQPNNAVYLAALSSRILGTPMEELAEKWNQYLSWRRSQPARSAGHAFHFLSRRRTILIEVLRRTMLAEPGEAGRRRALERLFDEHEASSFSRQLAARRSAKRISFREVLDALTGDVRGLLVYVPGRLGGFVFAVDGKGIRCEELAWCGNAASTHEFESTRRELRTAVRYREGERAEKAAADLATLLFPGATRRALEGWEEAGIIGTDLLGHVPFEMLPLEASSPMGTRLGVYYLPSLAVGAVLSSTTRHDAPVSLRVVAATAVEESSGKKGDEATPILLTDGEREHLKRGFLLSSSLVLGQEATPDALLRGDAGVALTHVLAHGVRLDDRERSAAFQLAPGGDGAVVGCAEVETMRASPIVILSICDALRGPAREGDGGMANLAGAFLLAGADAVLIAPERVTVREVVALVPRFQEALASGKTVASAWREAQEGAEGMGLPATGRFHVVGLGGTALSQRSR